MNEEIVNELLENIVQINNGESIMVSKEIVPDVRAIEYLSADANLIRVHRIEPSQKTEGWATIVFSITKHVDSEWVPNLELIVVEAVKANEIYSEEIILDDEINNAVCAVYQLEVSLIRFQQEISLENAVLERMGELERKFYAELYNVLVDINIIPDEAVRPDVEFHDYLVEIHRVEGTDNKQTEFNIRFSITANPYTQDEISTVESKIIELFQAYDFNELERIEKWPGEEERTEDAGAICVIYEMKIHNDL
jgi:hypothetical protein